MDRPWGQVVRDEFYSKVKHTEHQWKCMSGTVRTQKGTGYTNLTSYVKDKHPQDYERLCEEANRSQISSSTTPTSLWFDKKMIQINGWMDLVIGGLLPFSVVTNENFRRHVKYDSISRNTLMKYVGKLTKTVEEKIRKTLPDKFSIVFDAWSSGETHYVATFASYPSNCTLAYSLALLGFSPFENEMTQTAENHLSYLVFVLELYGKSLSNLVALIGDNCSSNKKLARIADTSLISCASHRYNLCVKDIIQNSSPIIEKVNSMMRKLRYSIPVAQLRKHTHLKAKYMNVTTSSSTATMLQRYFKIRPFLSELEIDGLIDMIPSLREDLELEKFNELFLQFDSVTKVLQRENISCPDVRFLFDGTIVEFPNTSTRLSSTAQIVASPQFESAIVKIQNNFITDLSESEKKSVDVLMRNLTLQKNSNAADCINESFAERLLKKRRVDVSQSTYIDIRFLLPTSNVCERLFSKAGYTLSSRRRNINPESLEQQMFLNANKEMWTICDVSKILESE